ncbi:MAG TPA: hypothetical protein VKX28_07565 [Xanthobacteraceae bacterium]|nr:hypothetical protein [Xanthobacteraceae bacterium]
MARKARSGAKASSADLSTAEKHAAALDKHTEAPGEHAKALRAAASAQQALTAALNKNTAALALVHSQLQKIVDTQSCVSKWLRDKGATEVESRTYTKNIADFHIGGRVEMNMFVAGVAKCLQGKKYRYTPTPSPDSADWGHLLDQLLNGTLNDLVNWFVPNIA